MKTSLKVLTGCLLLIPLAAPALIMVGKGNRAVRDAGWPAGAVEVANLDSRVGWWEGPPFGGGQWCFVYQGDTDAFTEALTTFTAIRTPVLDLVLHDGPRKDIHLEKEVDWTFTVWVPENWHRLFNNPKSLFDADQPGFRQPVDPPRLDVYVVVGRSLDWTKVKVPAGVHLRDERAAASGVSPVGGALVRADIYDMATGKPVDGARVVVASTARQTTNGTPAYETAAEATSGEGGHLEITKVPVGTYRFSATAGGYAPRFLGYEVLGTNTVKQLTIELAKEAAIRGTVLDSAGKALAGVQVQPTEVLALNGRGYTAINEPAAESDAQGHFELSGLPIGYVQLRVQAKGYYYGDVFAIYDVPGDNVTLRLTGAGVIVGTVTDNEGKPLSRLNSAPLLVDVEPKGGTKVGAWGGGATVKEDGTFEFDNVPPGEYRVTSRPNPSRSNREYAPEQIITVTAGGRATVKVVYD